MMAYRKKRWLALRSPILRLLACVVSVCLLVHVIAPVRAATPSSSGLDLSLTCANGSPIWMSSVVGAPIFGVVMKTVTNASAQQRILDTQSRTGATIDPAFTENERVFVKADKNRLYVALVPAGMIVHVGDDVSFVPAHADAGNPCLYTPNLIVR